jgi:chromate transporter
MSPPVGERTSLRKLALLFLKLGTIAFGGPAAHIAMMEDEVVRRRGWLTREQFLDYLGATNLIPGPNSTEMAIHVGYERRGWPGLVVAGLSFILPAALIVSGIAWAYVRFGTLPTVTRLLYGVKPVVIAVVLQALWGLGRSAVKTRWLGALGGGAVLANALGVNELVVLAAAGAAMAFIQARPRLGGLGAGLATASGSGSVGIAVAGAATPFGLWPLFAVFVKIGAVLFGSGYVLLAFLRADLVVRLHWLTETQLLDAVAVGQVTPGPVFTTATFIGYVLGRAPGAAVATVGIFLPAFVFVALSGPLVPRLRRSPVAGAVLDGVNVASLALMAVVTWQLGRAALIDPLTGALAVLSAVALLRFGVNSAWLVAGGAAVGLLVGAL